MPALLTNASATGTAKAWPGGPGTFHVVGSLSGAVVSLEYLGLDGATYITVASVASDGIVGFVAPPGMIRAKVSGGSPSGLYASADSVPDASSAAYESNGAYPTNFDDGPRRHIDSTSSATYTYIYGSWDANAATTDAKWICKRVTNSTGSYSFANGVTNFSDQSSLITVAQGLTATYAG